jgi:putative Holliday junction resolvase
VSRIIAFDHGSRRVGVAVADTETGQAFARRAIRVGRGGDIGPLVALARAERAEQVVVGLPRNMDGSEGPQAEAARRFADELAKAGFDVIFVDERLTSWQAGETLAAAGYRPRREHGDIDSAAARLILQDYLDARRAPQAGADVPDHQEAG